MDERPITRTDLVDVLGAFEARLTALTEQLKTEVAGMKAGMAELRAEMAGLKTELRAEMAGLKAELKAEFATKAELAAMEQKLIDVVQEQVRDSQTEILKAFLPYQERTNVRFRGLDESRLYLDPPTA